jgi:aminopeptidase N
MNSASPGFALRLRHLALGAALAVATGSVLAAPADRVLLPRDTRPISYDIAVEPDAPTLTFKGSVAIRLEVVTATERIVLNCADLVIDRAVPAGTAAAPVISYDEKAQTAAFTFPAPLPPGTYTLALDYHGRIYQQSSGLFALDYDTAHGKERALFTQFENSDARRFVPCWDEPAQKATFALTATVPAGLLAISNTPIAATDALPDGRQRVHFARTPKMASYLLFFGLGDLERIHRDVDGVDVGVVVKRGSAAAAQYALDTASAILPYYNEYFGLRYPLPKLDLIAGPGTSQFFSAMENWGAIFYFEKSLLFDPKISSENDKRWIHIVIAHEMSHQWFGDLVTMDWWDDLWLNEGFASWMQQKATDHFHPEWKVWLDALSSKAGAMQIDARDGTHPVIVPIRDVLQASGAFDAITYQKGQAVIRMLEAYVGEDNFRAGVRSYMRHHAYGNTVTDDLWREIDGANPRKLTQIAHDFTLQPGVPMVTVEPVGTGLALTADRFAYDASGVAGGSWHLPVIIGPGGDPAGDRRVVVASGAPVTVPDVPRGAIVNAGQTGYFRVLYRGDAFTAVNERFASLSADDQIGILNDTYAFGCAGRSPLSHLLALAGRLPADADPSVWTMLTGRLAALDSLYDGLPAQAAFRSFATNLLRPLLERTGFETRAGETANTRILRSTVLTTLGQFSDPVVAAEALRRFSLFRQDPGTLTGTDRESVLTVAAINTDPAVWDELHNLARAAVSPLEKQQYYGLLGAVRDPALARQALDLALTTEADVTLRPRIVAAVSGSHPELALDFGIAHWDLLSSLIEPTTQARYIPRLASSASELAILDRLTAFAAAHISPGHDLDLRKAVAQIRYAAAIRTERLPEIDLWLADPRNRGTR